MKFTNLVVPINKCEIGEIVRISKTQTFVRITEKSLFSVTVQLLSGSGFSTLSVNQNVHRQID